MPDNENTNPNNLPATSGSSGKFGRAALNAVGGAIPFFGGILSAGASIWSESEQQAINDFLAGHLQMLRDELKEKHETMADILRRLDLQDDKVAKRIASPEYQGLIRKTFRNWAGAESNKKREYIRNVLSNAAATNIASDDVVRLFLDWLGHYSELHFAVVAIIYQNPGITRLETWEELGRQPVREDSADADLFKLLIRDLSMGGILRQQRDTDHNGQFVKTPPRRTPKGFGSRTMTSAFEDDKPYVLTELGQQFVHYAMSDVPIKLQYAPEEETAEEAAQVSS